MPADRQVIEPFVRNVLGCGCPEEVFQHLELGTGEIGPEGPRFIRLVVGDRLLIYLVASLGAHEAEQRLAAIAIHGLTERNRAGYNRFRLVIVSEPGSPVMADPGAFRRAVGDDARAHLHCLEASSVPPELMPPPPGPPAAAGD